MDIIKNHIPFSTAYNRRPNLTMQPTTITIHSTGNAKSTAKNERAWLENPSNDRTASWHYVVDENTIIEAIPPNYVAWHAGDGNGQGNRASIGIEMCESGDRAKVLAKTKELIKHLMATYNIRKVVRHYDWTKKNCPRILNADGKWTDWYPFLADVFKLEIKKEEPFMLEKAVVINSFADFPVAELLARRLNAPIYLRTTAEGKKVSKELYIVGGTKDKLVADKVTLLSGADRFDTAAAVKKFLG